MTLILMVQTSKYRWVLKTDKGVVLKDNLCFNTKADAERYVRAYISSYNNWTYETRPLND